jgi:hypothetical protein
VPGAPQLVPIHSVQDGEDYLIRGYTKCPAYARRLDRWFGSPEFKAKVYRASFLRRGAAGGSVHRLHNHRHNHTQPPPHHTTHTPKKQQEDETRALRAAVAAASPPSLNASLASWWNAYDAFNVWRGSGVGDPMPDVSDDQFNQIQALAYWLELAKMRSALAGNLLGGALLRDVGDRLGGTAAAYERSSSVRGLRPFLCVLGCFCLCCALALGGKGGNGLPHNSTSRLLNLDTHKHTK